MNGAFLDCCEYFRRHFSSGPPPALYSSVPEVFDRIRGVASKDIVEQVGAIYVFDVESKLLYLLVKERLFLLGV